MGHLLLILCLTVGKIYTLRKSRKTNRHFWDYKMWRYNVELQNEKIKCEEQKRNSLNGDHCTVN